MGFFVSHLDRLIALSKQEHLANYVKALHLTPDIVPRIRNEDVFSLLTHDLHESANHGEPDDAALQGSTGRFSPNHASRCPRKAWYRYGQKRELGQINCSMLLGDEFAEAVVRLPNLATVNGFPYRKATANSKALRMSFTQEMSLSSDDDWYTRSEEVPAQSSGTTSAELTRTPLNGIINCATRNGNALSQNTYNPSYVRVLQTLATPPPPRASEVGTTNIEYLTQLNLEIKVVTRPFEHDTNGNWWQHFLIAGLNAMFFRAKALRKLCLELDAWPSQHHHRPYLEILLEALDMDHLRFQHLEELELTCTATSSRTMLRFLEQNSPSLRSLSLTNCRINPAPRSRRVFPPRYEDRWETVFAALKPPTFHLEKIEYDNLLDANRLCHYLSRPKAQAKCEEYEKAMLAWILRGEEWEGWRYHNPGLNWSGGMPPLDRNKFVRRHNKWMEAIGAPVDSQLLQRMNAEEREGRARYDCYRDLDNVSSLRLR